MFPTSTAYSPASASCMLDVQPIPRRMASLPRMSKSGLANLLWIVGSAALVLILWVLIVVVLKPAAYVLPSPWAVMERLWVDRALLLHQGEFTISEILVGIGLSIGIAIPLGVAIVALALIQKLIYPIIVAFNAIPKVALAPLFVMWFGYGFLPRILVTTSIAFFPILIATIAGLTSIDPDLLKLAEAMNGRPLPIFLYMRLPHALPSIFSGIKVATSLAVIGAIIGEFVASDAGWGYLLVQASGTLDSTIMFAIVILLAIVASLLFYAVSLVEKTVVSWHASQRTR